MDRGSVIVVSAGCTTQPDHVHLLVECDPHDGTHRLVKRLKARSPRLLREQFPSLKQRPPTLWTNSHFVATVGGAPPEIVPQSMENQPRPQPPFPPHG